MQYEKVLTVFMQVVFIVSPLPSFNTQTYKLTKTNSSFFAHGFHHIYLFKVNNRNTTLEKVIKCVWKLTIKIQEIRHLRRSGVFIANFEHISLLFLVLLLFTLNKEIFAGLWLQNEFSKFWEQFFVIKSLQW